MAIDFNKLRKKPVQEESTDIDSLIDSVFAEDNVQEPVAEVKKTEPAETKHARQQTGNDQKKELQKVKNRFKQLEEKLEDLSGKKESLEKALANPDIYSNRAKFLDTESQYNQAKKEWEEANKEYEKVFEKMVELEG